MKKLAQINIVCDGSTGKIMAEIQKEANDKGYETVSFYGRRQGYADLRCEKIGGNFSVLWHVFLTTLFNLHGHASYFPTKKLVEELRKFNPDIIYLHNIHGYYLNYKLLFDYLKNDFEGEIKWLLHDCWAFTGHCASFVMEDCNKWKEGCYHCPQVRGYPFSLVFDSSKKEYLKKKEAFVGLKNMSIIVPSGWLKEMVEESFLSSYCIAVKHNKINLDIFKPTHSKEIFEKFAIPQNKKLLLAVANVWSKNKGLSYLLELAEMLDDEMVLLIVGLPKSKSKGLNRKIIPIQRTQNQKELAALYSVADLYINPTLEESFGMTNLEAIACGTPVITFASGGSTEMITESTGLFLEEKTVERLLQDINEMIGKDYKRKIFCNKDHCMLKAAKNSYF